MRYILFICVLLISNTLQGQIDYAEKFNQTLHNPKVDGNINSIKARSLNGNVLSFMEIGYFINSNVIRENYALNVPVITNLITSGRKKSGDYKWLVTEVPRSSGNYKMKGKEFILYEGYLFRYIAQHQYLSLGSKLKDPDLVKNNFNKWYKRSIRYYGDASMLYGIRLHMGSHWATVAAYLTKIDPENRKLYQAVVLSYDQQLRKALKIVTRRGKACYVWNATYPEKVTSALRKRKNETVIQDVSHGNHIIQYVVDCYNLGIGSWKRQDLERFANTLKYIIWQDNLKPADNVDGTYSTKSGIKGMGWKQSDGWMKLMVILNDKTLFDIYDNYYKKRSSKIDRLYPNLQYFALMAAYQEMNK